MIGKHTILGKHTLPKIASNSIIICSVFLIIELIPIFTEPQKDIKQKDKLVSLAAHNLHPGRSATGYCVGW